MEAGTIYVRKVRTRVAPGADRACCSLRLGRALGAADFSIGLPPETILCVRRFAAPLPGRLGTDGAQPPASWRQAVSEGLRTLATRAPRPAREIVGANANAVLFADRAELLACLARDWCCGDAHSQWWWRLLFPALDLGDAVVKAWIENPQHVPTALRRLEKVNGSRDFLAAIPRSSAARILERVLAMFDLDGLRPELAIGQGSTPSAFDDAPLVSARAPEPWLPWVEVDPWLPAEQRQLLVIALMLEQAPGVLRSVQFSREWRAWQRRMNEPAAEADPPSPGLNNGQADAVGAVSTPNPNEGAAVALKFAALANSVSTRTKRAGDVRSQSVSVQFQKPGDDLPTTISPGPAQPVVHAPDAGFHPVSRPPVLPAALAEPRRQVVRTEWGGVFYLLNVALAFGLYGDFTRPRHAGLALPVWDFLTLLGQRMAGSESFADPLWPLLACLSGRREGEPPACGFEPPAEWRMPLEWLAGFEPHGDWRWAATRGRLRLRHPLGFLVLDLLRSAEAPARQLENELRRLGADFEPVLRDDDDGTMPALITDSLVRWVDWLLPCVRARLASALGVTDSTARLSSNERRAALRAAAASLLQHTLNRPGIARLPNPLRPGVSRAGPSARPGNNLKLCSTALSALVLQHGANVEVTADSVTVGFRLAEHPIELRMSGLDRDPGWVPAAGRRIAFHYD